MQPMNPPQMLYQGSHSLAGGSPLGQARHVHVQELFARQRVPASQHRRAQGVSDWTKVRQRGCALSCAAQPTARTTSPGP